MDKKYAQIVRGFTVRVVATVIVIGSHSNTVGVPNGNSKDVSA
jgi:hypothetical protein